MNLSLPTKTAGRLCLTWGETAYRLVFPESWYDEVPETKDTNGLKDVLHLWVFNGFQKLGDWKNLNTSISLLYSGFLAFSRLYFQHSHPNEVQKMQLLATYAKNMKKRLIAASQEIWTSTFEWLQVPVKPELTNYGMADPRTVRVLDPSIFDHRVTSSVMCSDDWGETLGIDLGPFSGSCWTGTPGIWISNSPSFLWVQNSEADLCILHLVSILYPCTVLWR